MIFNRFATPRANLVLLLMIARIWTRIYVLAIFLHKYPCYFFQSGCMSWRFFYRRTDLIRVPDNHPVQVTH